MNSEMAYTYDCFLFKVIPVAVGVEVDPDQLPISPVITDPSPDLGKPDKLVVKIMSRVLVGKILVGASLKRKRHRFFAEEEKNSRRVRV